VETLFIDFDDPQMLARIEALKPLKGYCILLDISGSTRLKDMPTKKWIIHLYNTFANMRTFLLFLRPLKCIGDEMMFYVPVAESRKVFGGPLGLFSATCSIVSEKEELFRDVKASIVFCRSAYAIAFVRQTSDIYGKEIDLAARLLAKAKARQVIMSKSFYEALKRGYKKYGDGLQVPEFSEIDEVSYQLKGFRGRQTAYKITL